MKKGDIVTVYIPEHLGKGKDYVVKRIIAIGNDTVEINNGKIFVNGDELKEEYINGSDTQEVNQEYSKLTIPEDCVYILGDNRFPHASLDSRSIGPVQKSKITGKVMVRYYPFKKAGWLERITLIGCILMQDAGSTDLKHHLWSIMGQKKKMRH